MESLKPVQACRPVSPWIGGKKHLAKQISGILARTPHVTYAEAFVGMGGVFFRRTMRPEAEVINDYSREVSNLFRVLQRHYQAFLDMFRWQIASRSEFERLLKVAPETLTDLERAARFLYLQRTCFSGKVRHQCFGVAPDKPARFDITKLVPMLEDVHERLAAVTIECLDYKEFIPRYDAPGTLFYLDPPYYGCEDDYGRELFSRDEFALMAAQLAQLKGKFVLSLNDCPQVREIFKGFIIRPVKVVYSLGGAAGREFGEVLISNYEAVLLHEQASLI